jgi:glycosyltransferase involved in cell wall biosynthesis
VSMIIRDEPIDRLVMLIDFMRNSVADDFVVVDTGTEDWEWQEKCINGAGGRYARIDWPDDFSVARNETLKYIDTDFVLHLDADEWPSHTLIDWMMQTFNFGSRTPDESDPRTLGYLIFTRNYWGGERGIEVEAHWHCRLFRNGRGRWYKKLHEQVELDGKHESQTRDTVVLPKAPKDAYIIHSKPREKIEHSAALYERMS